MRKEAAVLAAEAPGEVADVLAEDRAADQEAAVLVVAAPAAEDFEAVIRLDLWAVQAEAECLETGKAKWVVPEVEGFKVGIRPALWAVQVAVEDLGEAILRVLWEVQVEAECLETGKAKWAVPEVEGFKVGIRPALWAVQAEVECLEIGKAKWVVPEEEAFKATIQPVQWEARVVVDNLAGTLQARWVARGRIGGILPDRPAVPEQVRDGRIIPIR